MGRKRQHLGLCLAHRSHVFMYEIVNSEQEEAKVMRPFYCKAITVFHGHVSDSERSRPQYFCGAAEGQHDEYTRRAMIAATRRAPLHTGLTFVN